MSRPCAAKSDVVQEFSRCPQSHRRLIINSDFAEPTQMTNLHRLRHDIVRSEEGATMVEYGLMVALIAVVCIAAVTALGVGVRDNLFAAAVAAL